MSAGMTVAEYLEGKGFNQAILNVSPDGTSFTREDVPDDFSNDHEGLREALRINTHELMLAFLEKYKNIPAFRGSVKIFHKNCDHRFPGHEGGEVFIGRKVSYHEDSIDGLIDFVKMHVKEKSGIRYLFNKTGKFLGHTYSTLDRYSKIPVLGIFSSSLKVLVAAAQAVVGLALCILSAPFALFSENASVIFHRSFRHAGFGPGNVVSGLFQMIFYGIFCAGLFSKN